MQLSVEVIKDNERTRIAVAGEVDVSNADNLRAPLEGALESAAGDGAASDGTASDGAAGVIEVDIAEVSYIDSTGIGVLVGAARRATSQGCEFELVRPQANVKRVLSLLGVIDELHVRDGDQI